MKIYEVVKQSVTEGPNDPMIFKAVFTAGGPGSGKSYVVKHSALEAMGFKIVNSDSAFEKFMTQAGMDQSPDNIYSPQGQEMRDRAKSVTKRKQEIYTDHGRLGLVMDGTGKNYEKIVRMSEKLKALGYETAMLFVNTDIETALDRNEKRDRSLPPVEVKQMWKDVQNNIGKFQRYFKNNMIIVDNSEDSNSSTDIQQAYKQISAWGRSAPQSRIAKDWLKKAQDGGQGN